MNDQGRHVACISEQSDANCDTMALLGTCLLVIFVIWIIWKRILKCWLRKAHLINRLPGLTVGVWNVGNARQLRTRSDGWICPHFEMFLIAFTFSFS